MKIILLIKKYLWILANILVLLIYLFIANKNRITDPRPLIKDSEEYLTLSYHLANDGLFSYDGVTPTNFREPLSSFLNAINIKYFTNIKENTPLENLKSQLDIVMQLTQINIFYLLLLYFVMWWMTFQMTNSHAWVFISTFLPMTFFSIDTTYLKGLLSDLPSLILLSLCVSIIISTYKRPSIVKAIILSLSLALLIISKGVFYYLVPVYVLIVVFLIWFKQLDTFRKGVVRHLAVSLLGAFLILSPWMLRNYQHFNDFSLTQRGGTILMIRAEKNQMNQEEFWGAFYVYSPDVLKRLIFEKWLGYKETDYEDAGKLQRLNRNLKNDYSAIESGSFDQIKSFLRRTMYVSIPKIQAEAVMKGVDKDEYLKNKALSLIENQPGKHLKTSLLFAWRGLWFYQGNHLSFVLLIVLSYLAFACVLFKALFQIDVKIIIFLGLPVLIFLFHSFLTHNISRYLLPILPFVSLCLLLIIIDFLNYHKKVKV